MTKGYVLINVRPGLEMETYETLMKIEGVVEVSPLLGDIDFILMLERDTPDEIANIVVRKVRIVVGVMSTKTMIEDDFVKHFEVLL